MAHLTLPTANGLERYDLCAPRAFDAPPPTTFNRVAFSAAHVVADPFATGDPWSTPAIDWDRTLGFRHHLWSLGLGVAEAMDTAQRGMGLNWTLSQELIARSLSDATQTPGALIACGVGTDHLDADDDTTIDDVVRAYEEQAEFVEARGGRIILMASRALVRAARRPADYAYVYGRVLSAVKAPVILHWLGAMFDPALEGYWGATDHSQAMEVALEVIEANVAKVDGIKISLLDKEKEVVMRRRLPAGVRMYTGDDFNYVDLIVGDGFGAPHQAQSDALLGIFDAIAPAASAGLSCLAAGDEAGFRAILEPTVPLSRHIFRAPTRWYKTGVVFMAYLNGHQDHFTMVGGQQSARSIQHLSELFRLADAANLLTDKDVAADRMRRVLALAGVL
ncbi:hypothetical protein ASD21_22055 [Caulobacter sp. Root1455]|uniref:dihydrodipicolinate synthase family protein n=1 Tax=unclassified Caulobacter TaxID=2648921 RepID=UPI0006F2CB9C|nr:MULTISPECIES: dihydrodipicolinate synthase family protein [unclassified Caulobacter]KQY32969.1 hypothetical protein ASD38_22080 [Caulobacter sp. Root487D2Y]KQZ02644.1 hypothetical protein ASD21_22055 [Caulobacter sp. Root1455]